VARCDRPVRLRSLAPMTVRSRSPLGTDRAPRRRHRCKRGPDAARPADRGRRQSRQAQDLHTDRLVYQPRHRAGRHGRRGHRADLRARRFARGSAGLRSRRHRLLPDFGQASASWRVPLNASRARRKSSGRGSVVVMVRGPVRILMCDHRPAARSDLKPELAPYRRKAAARVPAAPWPYCRRSQP
jgi:hypothetical protein